MAIEESRVYIVKQLREFCTIRGKLRTWISDLDDKELWWLYDRMRRGASSRSLASALIDRGIGPGSSVRSMAQGISKFKRRIAHLLLDLPDREIEAPKGLADMKPEERLEAIERTYAQLIDQMLADASSNYGLMTTDMAKHVTALATISKARAKMVGKPVIEIPSVYDEDLKAKSDLALNFIGDDGPKMIRAANAFLDEFLQECEVIDIDPRTGEIISPSAPKR